MLDEDRALAAEYALGLLEGEELRAATRRVLGEHAFAAEVTRWQNWLAVLLAAYPDIAPPERLEERIIAAIPVAGALPIAANDRAANDAAPNEGAANEGAANEGAPGGPARRLRWGGFAALAAAVLVFALVLGPVRSPPPVPVSAPRPAPLLAALAVQDGQAAQGRTPLAASVDRATGEIRIAGAAAVPSARDAQLWAIGTDGRPVPLGLLAATGPTRLTVARAARALLAAGTTLAVSIEPRGGSPTGQPTGPVVAAGALS